MNKDYTIHLTDEQYRKVIDAAQKDANKEIIDKINKKIEWLKQISDNGINAVRFAASYEDEIERKERQKNISTTINILEELKGGNYNAK